MKDYPYNLSKEEIIRRIEEVYHAKADPTNLRFDVYDQLLACEVIKEAEDKERRRTQYFKSFQDNISKNEGSKENVVVNGMSNDGYKRRVKFELTENKQKAIKALQECDYRTPPIKIAKLLEEFFIEYPSYEGHWLYVAQQWPPRRINLVINHLIKLHNTGSLTIQNPPALFTYLIKFRKKRSLIGINGTR